MAVIVHIETTTRVCSAALSQDRQCICSRESTDGPSHGTLLGPYVSEMVSMADSHAIPIDAVAVSRGPGSYTGLRIGASTAKGLCYARNLKLIPVDTLQLLCVPLLLYRDDLPQDALFCPMLDARRMEVYTAVYTRALTEVLPVQAKVVDSCSFRDQLAVGPVVFFGDGAAKCKDVVCHPNAIFVGGIVPLAKHMVPLAEMMFARGQTVDPATFEPFYLKNFVPTTPKKLFD